MAIKAIFFDIDNTLYDTAEFAERARRNAINSMRESGLNTGEEKAYRTLTRVISRRSSNYDFHFNEMLRELGVKPSPRIIAAGVVAYHNTKASILPFPEVKRTLLMLRDSGYRLYVASEGMSMKQWDKLIRLGLHLIFHDVFVTEDRGRKKSKAFYSAILGELGLRPHEALMVGDSEEKDIIPAKRAGMRTVLVTHGGRNGGKADFTIRDLTELRAVIERL